MNDGEGQTLNTIGKHIIRGSAWMVAMRWSMRGIGILSTVILARLLLPEDYGLVAVSMIIVAFIEVFSWTHADLALIQNPNAGRAHYDAAWTLNILVGFAAGGFLLIVAPLAGTYFGDERIIPVIQLFALRPVFVGFENIGVVAFRKELNFSKEFMFFVYGRLITFVVTIAIAWIYRNYWALAIGMVCTPGIRLIMSYCMHPYRPRLSFRKMKEIWRFARWMTLFNIGEFFTKKTDEIIVANVASTSLMGNYSVASRISLMLTSEVVAPLERSLLPAYAKLSHDSKEMEAAFFKVFSTIAIICTAAGAGMSAVADDLVAVLLGANWTDTAPIIAWLAIFGGVSGIAYCVRIVLIAIGSEKSNAILIWVQALILAPILLIAGIQWGLIEVAIARAAVAIIFAVVLLILVVRRQLISAGLILSALWRPMVSAAVMFVAVKMLHSDSIGPPILRLAADVTTGAFVFAGTLFACWWLAGRPDGTERVALNFLARRISSWRNTSPPKSPDDLS